MSDEPRQQDSGISLKTLLIAGAASATAAFVVPLIWEPGTVFAAATTPIIVAIVSELLKKPAATVGVVRSRRTAPRREEPFDPLAPPAPEELDALPRTTSMRRAVHSRRGLSARQWRLALLTGLAAFACAVGVVTASELVAGEGGAGDPTTFLGGSGGRAEQRPAVERPDEEPTPRSTPTVTPTPTPTATPAPTTTPIPTPTVTSAPAAPEAAAPASPTPAP